MAITALTSDDLKEPARENTQLAKINEIIAEVNVQLAGDIQAVVAGAGMTGGGTTGSVTLDVVAGTNMVVNANDIATSLTPSFTTVATTGAFTTGGTVTLTAADGTVIHSATSHQLHVKDSTAQAAGVGGAISFVGKYTDAGAYVDQCAVIKAMKTNSTDGNYSFDMAFGTRANGGLVVEAMRIKDTGAVELAGALNVTGVVTGTTAALTGTANTDTLQASNAAAGQTVGTDAIQAAQTGSYNTTAGAINAVTVRAEATATRSAGANPLANFAIYANASGGQSNYSLYCDAGAVHLGAAAATVGFYGTAPIAKQTGVAVTDAGIHAALVALGLIAA